MAEEFFLVSIPVKDLDIVDVGDKDRLNRYVELIKSGVDMGPSWGVYGRFRRSGEFVEPHTKGKISVLDGNHRALASKKAGKSHIMVIIPDISFNKYVEDTP